MGNRSTFQDAKDDRARDKIRGSGSLALLTILGLLLIESFSYLISTFYDDLLTPAMSWGVSLALVLLFGLVLWVVLHRQYPKIQKQVNAEASLIDGGDIPDHAYLICGYSPCFDFKTGEATGPAAVGDWSQVDRNLDVACALKDPQNLKGWQQNLRILRRFENCLKTVYVIENEKLQFDRFARCMRHFMPDLTLICITDPKTRSTTLLTRGGAKHDPDYEVLDYVTKAIDLAFAAIKKSSGLSVDQVHEETLIDITAGQKPLSVAMSIASLNRNMFFVYTGSFGDNEGQISGYDVRIQFGKQPVAV